MKLEIKVPEDNMGDVMGNMNKRRGKILGMEPILNLSLSINKTNLIILVIECMLQI